ncbi:MAG: restriction endonuclease subunit S [Candidatus Anammoxibacter sp.]
MRVKLTDICRPKQWKTISMNQMLNDGYPVYGANGKIGFYSEYTHEKPTLLITCRGATCGTVNISEPFSYVNGNAMALDDIDIAQTDIHFLYYCFFYRGFRDVISGSAQPQITRQGLEKVVVDLPEIKMQKRIVQILDIADSLRQKRKEQLKLLDDYLKSLFLEMFGDPDNNFEGYEITTIGDITSHIKDGPHVSPKYSDKGIPILSTRNIRPAELVLDDMKYVSSETYNELTRRFCPKQGDVLVTKGGTTGYAKAVDFDWFFCVWVHIAVLRPLSEVEAVYLEGAMNSEYCYIQSQRYTHGIANRDLGLTRIAKIKLLKPPYDEQKKYVEIVRNVQSLKQKMRASLDEMDNHFNALMQRYFGKK